MRWRDVSSLGHGARPGQTARAGAAGAGLGDLRIWSTDWWISAPDALEKVHGRLGALLEASRVCRAEEALREETAEGGISVVGVPAQGGAAEPGRAESVPPVSTRHGVDVPQHGERQFAAYARNVSEDRGGEGGVRVFREADPGSVVSGANADQFFEAGYDATLRDMIAHVVEVEGPVRSDVLAKRIARAHGWSRTGARIQDRVFALAKRDFATSTEDVGVFFWPTGSDTVNWQVFRRAAGDEVRPVDEIALPELTALARDLRARGLDGEEGVAAMAREAGLLKLRAVTRERLGRAWAEALAVAIHREP